MLNQSILVGRLVSDPQIKETENGRENTIITIAVPRSFKNMNGEYDTDFVDCVLWDGIATNTTEYCRKGDLIGVKGRLQKNSVEDNLIVVAEKITFLSSRNKEEN